MVSLAANLTLPVAVLSYAGLLNLTAVADRDSCSDVEVFAKGAQTTLDYLPIGVLPAYHERPVSPERSVVGEYDDFSSISRAGLRRVLYRRRSGTAVIRG